MFDFDTTKVSYKEQYNNFNKDNVDVQFEQDLENYLSFYVNSVTNQKDKIKNRCATFSMTPTV